MATIDSVGTLDGHTQGGQYTFGAAVPAGKVIVVVTVELGNTSHVPTGGGFLAVGANHFGVGTGGGVSGTGGVSGILCSMFIGKVTAAIAGGATMDIFTFVGVPLAVGSPVAAKVYVLSSASATMARASIRTQATTTPATPNSITGPFLQDTDSSGGDPAGDLAPPGIPAGALFFGIFGIGRLSLALTDFTLTVTGPPGSQGQNLLNSPGGPDWGRGEFFATVIGAAQQVAASTDAAVGGGGVQFQAVTGLMAYVLPGAGPGMEDPYLIRTDLGQFNLYIIDSDGRLKVRLYDADDHFDALVTVDGNPNDGLAGFCVRDGAILGVYQVGGLFSVAVSYNQGRNYFMSAIPGTWDSGTMQEHKGRIVFIGYRASVPGWLAVVAEIDRDPTSGALTFTWGAEGTVPTTSATGKGHLREALDGDLNLAYEGPALTWNIITCRNLTHDGAGDWF